MASPQPTYIDEPPLNGDTMNDATGQEPTESRVHQQGLAPSKRFRCNFEGCGKYYSRAEHLERHALNHAPKEIFHCTYPRCKRWFVRQDLRARHVERHGRRNSRIFKSQRKPTVTSPDDMQSIHDSGNPNISDETPIRMNGSSTLAEILRSDRISRETASRTNPVVEQSAVNLDFQPFDQSNSLNQRVDHQAQFDQTEQSQSNLLAEAFDRTSNHRHSWSHAATQSAGNHNVTTQLSDQSPQRIADSSTTSFDPSAVQQYSIQSNIDSTHVRGRSDPSVQDAQHFSMVQSLGNATIAPAVGSSQPAGTVNGMLTTSNDQQFSESPSSVRDEFTAWLFDNNSQSLWNGFNPNGGQALAVTADFSDLGLAIGSNYFSNPFGSAQYPSVLSGRSPIDILASPQDLILDTTLSTERWTYLIDFMHTRFNGSNDPKGQFQREQILQGNLDADDHPLSLRLMKAYIGSYWQNFHDQFPILHRPTFSADHAPDLLLFAVMAIGASLLSNEYGDITIAAAQNFANFIAWHLRWQIYMDNNFNPPAKLWVFQTLLLLEVYEKTNSTRALHERANIHNATTINLMRRSTGLNEDFNPLQRQPSTPHEWWERWINAEATRRVAYAAFLLDATHANMFGHSAVMVIQEIRLPLPCDEALWSANSPAEVGLVESSLHANSIKATTFLQGMKRILTGRKVRTNSFGRLVLMAGLLSISWHMRQRELQGSTLGVPQALSVPDTWRSTLTNAFDFWKRDFNDDIAHMRMAPIGWQFSGPRLDSAVVIDHATVLHHLSHLALQVDIMDCQIAAGAPKLMGRAVTVSERDRVHRKLSKWSRGEGARQALYHSIQLLRKFLIRIQGEDGATVETYNARNDSLLSRSWVIYFAALVIWCYSFFIKRNIDILHSADSGTPDASAPSSPRPNIPIQPFRHFEQFDYPVDHEKVRRFLESSATKTIAEMPPANLDEQTVGSILQLLASTFQESRWELLHEASDRLRQAITIEKKGD